MVKDIFYNKMANIERCINRVSEVYENDVMNLKDNTKFESIVLNIELASEFAIDLAMHIIAEGRLGIPKSSIDAFEILKSNNILNESVGDKMKEITSFRNMVLHDYENISIILIQGIIENNLYDFYEYINSLNTCINEMGDVIK